jgi:hypothetical protein
MSREKKIMSALQYLWDEGFLKLWVQDGEARVALTTEVEEAHEAIRSKFAIKKDSADWWKNETKK